MRRNWGHRRLGGWPVRLIALLAVGATAGLPAAGDIFHLETGGTIDGQLLATEDGHYTIRTSVGIVRIPILSVQRVEVSDTPFEQYDERAARTADTPAEQTALANWCEEQGLRAEARRHWQRALELNPDYAPARRALGQVRVGELWVDGRQRAAAPRDATTTAPSSDPERVARAIQGQWRQQIRAVKRAFLDSSLPGRFDEGRSRILEIDDPLAILPLSEVLGAGSPACRRLLIEALSAFPYDEATMNVAILALLDPEFDIRERALHEVGRRQDDRVVAQYRDALRTGDDWLVARAAAALGYLEAHDAVPELIEALTVQRHRWVEVPTRRWVQFWPHAFAAPIVISCYSGVTLAFHEPRVGVCRGSLSGQWAVGENRWAYRRVTVRRTQVLEALKRITGENFGFERDQWHRWYEGGGA